MERGASGVARMLAQYDAEMRHEPPPIPRHRILQEEGRVVLLGEHRTMIWGDIDSARAASVVARWAADSRAGGRELEWKIYGHDRAAGLPAILEAEGFVPQPLEILMAFDLRGPGASLLPPAGVEIRRAVDRTAVDDAAAVEALVSGGDGAQVRELMAGRWKDPEIALLVAYRGPVPVASGRVDLPLSRRFASLWGGSTVPAERGKGIYQTLVAARAEIARARGFETLTVDARDDTSRPILERLGFVPLTRIEAWVLAP
ncbi:MAG: GNAT family N-acetyltransferase [Thermoplasmata archaeon]|nr:GNAT family N-acetyltransferase [Thermoplasmata archaeon]